MRKVCKILLNCLCCITIFCVLIIASYIFQVTILHKLYANIFGYSLFTIKSGSMMPTINVNDDIIVKIGSEYQEGDIIVFEDDGMLVSHRVINIEGDSITTKGDNNNTEDKSFDKSLVVGKVIKILPDFGTIQSFFRKPIVIILIINIVLISTLFVDFNKEKTPIKELKN